MLHQEKSTREATNAVLCVKVQPHDVDSDKADKFFCLCKALYIKKITENKLQFLIFFVKFLNDSQKN